MATFKLATLTGTPKQVKWANTIRKQLLNYVNRTAQFNDVMALVQCDKFVSASFWIDRRDDMDTLLNDIIA